ncbi:hypothetical protein D9615_006404 [Tricholomella constricta]|uniref:Copper-fist domain-containing protein n=1 Tax=Tricholomella constricta TaxID=117010 RepID=A0A8H5M1K3_9AGAR|nr:hypothetical protein D9615_006404 [Tricholomella constricta]
MSSSVASSSLRSIARIPQKLRPRRIAAFNLPSRILSSPPALVRHASIFATASTHTLRRSALHVREHPPLTRSMFIQTETTPNDDSLKFIPGVPVMGDGTAEFLDTRSALVSPLAIRLMGVEGVTGVFYGPDFVTVSKDPEVNWAVMKPEIYSILMESFSSGQPLFRSEEDRENAGPQDMKILDTDSETVAMIKELLETRVRPAIMEDGGDIEYRGFDQDGDGLVRVRLKGSCRGCSSSTVTLKSGIERMMMHYIPEVKGVEQILDQEEEVSLDEFNKLEQKLADKESKEGSGSESCIKGHRSSSCHHTDRPLFEIKKKGRPVSQCQKCRELRQSKRVHSKCTCNERKDSTAPGETSKALTGTKSKRFIPIVPALPNGLQDVLKASRISSALPADVRQRVDSLLNPCPCRSVWKCKCRTSPNGKAHPGHERGLDALARAAEMFEKEASTSIANTSGPRKTMKRISSRPSSPTVPSSHKRTKHAKIPSQSPGPDLAPIFLDALAPSTSGLPPPIPTFETMPPMSMITSLAGSGCTCGLRCACPGCLEHRGPDHAFKERRNCADGCGTCVDHTAGVALPSTTPSSDSSPASNILDRFFARAAALPAPPTNRRMGVGVELDPMNVMVYPDAARGASDRALAFGLVTIPKLECCGGRCACPDGLCGCGKACDGCCIGHYERAEERRRPAPVEVHAPIRIESPPVAPVRSCCAGKAVAAAA